MNERLASRLEKVLALAESSHEGEAIGAIRMARQILSSDGLNFGDLARAAATRSRFNLPLNLFAGQHTHLETQIVRLQQEVYDLQQARSSQQAQIDFWQRRATDLEQQVNLCIADARRWRQLARETVEKLWDTGQAIQQEADEVTPLKKTA